MNFPAWQRNLSPLLWPASKAYALLMQLRQRCYATGLLRSGTLSAPCVSVGNISWGGSGKTPVAAWLVSWAASQGLHPVVLTRGYRARPPELPYAVRTDSPVRDAGDEPLLLRQSCPNATVLVDPKRLRAGHKASRLQPDLFILDDGMQHLAVRRDINLVLMREADLLNQWNKVIPAGSWRESKSALCRASAFLLKCTQSPAEEVLKAAEKRLAGFNKALFTFSLRAKRIISVKTGCQATIDPPYLIVTGIADPDSVVKSATSLLNGPPETVLAFSDHHDFDKENWNKIVRYCRQYAVKTILCTPKDAVKLKKFNYTQLYTFDMTIEFGPFAGTSDPFPAWWGKNFYDFKQKTQE